ncbi:hypothetical protein PG984_003890 [Apiospora sp. TS-2023a]
MRSSYTLIYLITGSLAVAVPPPGLSFRPINERDQYVGISAVGVPVPVPGLPDESVGALATGAGPPRHHVSWWYEQSKRPDKLVTREVAATCASYITVSVPQSMETAIGVISNKTSAVTSSENPVVNTAASAVSSHMTETATPVAMPSECTIATTTAAAPGKPGVTPDAGNFYPVGY